MYAGIGCAGVEAGLFYLCEVDQPGAAAAHATTMSKLRAFWDGPYGRRHLAHGSLVCLWLPQGGQQRPRLVFGTVFRSGGSGGDAAGLLAYSPRRARVGVVPCGAAFNDALVAFSARRVPAAAAAASEALLLEVSDSYFSYEPVLKALQMLHPATLPFQVRLLRRIHSLPQQHSRLDTCCCMS